MPVTNDGWLDWAIRLQPNPPNKNINNGFNSGRGIFMHSAEGYASVLLDPNSIYGYNGQHSWHISNLMDGRVIQHHPFSHRCWHATAANNEYIGVENEGYTPNEKSLNAIQVTNAVRFIKEISEWKGWQPKRPINVSDISHTLWEHNEVVRLGGTSSSCPSGRIPWNTILNLLNPPEIEDDNDMISNHAWATWFESREIAGGTPIYLVQMRSDFTLPTDAKAAMFEAHMEVGSNLPEFLHGNSDMNATSVSIQNTPNGSVQTFIANMDERGTVNMRCLAPVKFRHLHCVGYFR